MSVTIDQQFVEYIIKSLVSKPEAVKIERRIDEKGVLLELTVDPEDLGRVIGKRGATAQSVRTLLRALGTKNEARYNLKIVDNGEPKPERVASAPQQSSQADDDDTSANDNNNQVSDEVEAEPEVKEPIIEDEVDEPRDDNRGTLADRTRRELADLDDLDL